MSINVFKEFYKLSMLIGDVDPAYPCLRYIADRHELNLQQRYWLAYLYALSYCATTAYYMFNQFPDYENVNIERICKWWIQNKEKTYFQTDRRRIKSYNIVDRMIESYMKEVGQNQHQYYSNFLLNKDPKINYKFAYKGVSNFYYFGRFSIFNLLQSVRQLTNLNIQPDGLDLKGAQSCRNGLCYALDKKDMMTKINKQKMKNVKIDYRFLQNELIKLYQSLKKQNAFPVTYWNIETVLCAFKKIFWKTRYLGYYIDRQLQQINIARQRITKGINWDIMFEFRKQFFNVELLGQIQGWNGIRKQNMNLYLDCGIYNKNLPKELKYNYKVELKNIGDPYKT